MSWPVASKKAALVLASLLLSLAFDPRATAQTTDSKSQQQAEIRKRWAIDIISAIQHRWQHPAGNVYPSRPVKLGVHLQPSGEVMTVQPVSGSGNQLFDDSVITAVYKASPLPLPSDPAAFDPVITITFVQPR